MMHGQGAGQAAMAGCACGGGDCPMMMADVEKKVENTKTGVVITLSSKNAETVKKIQEHAAKAKTDKGGEAKTPAAMKEGACSCPGCKK
jgi:TusA-related sulfurtransferase